MRSSSASPARNRRPVWWPFSWWIFVIPVALILLINVSASLATMELPFQDWGATSAMFHDQFAWAGPIAASTAAFVAARLSPRTRVFGAMLGPRLGPATCLRQVTLVVAVMLVAYAAGLVPVLWETAQHAQYGGPDWLAIVDGLIALAAASSVGYLIGVLVKSVLCVPVTFVVFFALSMGNALGDSVLTPVEPFVAYLGQHESVPTGLYRVAFFALCATVAVTVAAMLSAQGRYSTRIKAPAIGALTALPILLVVPVLVKPPMYLDEDATAPAVCESYESVRYCVHAGHRSVLAQITTASAPVIAAYGVDNMRSARVYDSSLAWVTPASAKPLWVTVQPADFSAANVTNQIASALTAGGCERRRTTDDNVQAATMVAAWLQRGGTISSRDWSGHPWIGWSRRRVQMWIADHRAAIESCSLTPDDLS